MPQQIAFTVPGVPQGKGRAKSSSRIGRDAKTGATRVMTRHYTPDKTVAYESLVKLVAAQAMAGREAYTGPIRIDLEIVMPIPQSWSRTRQSRALAGLIRPTVKPDADNVEKAIKDGCNGVVFRDDCQAVEGFKRKVYGLVPRVDAVLTVLDMEPAQGVKKNAP